VTRWYSVDGDTHVHNVVEDHKRGALCLLLISNANLADSAVPAEQVVQVFASNLVVQIFDEEDTVGTRRKLRWSSNFSSVEIARESHSPRVWQAP
jgi:hypothetical protein